MGNFVRNVVKWWTIFILKQESRPACIGMQNHGLLDINVPGFSYKSTGKNIFKK